MAMDEGISIRDISTDSLVAELALRHGASTSNTALQGPKPECSSGERGAYDTPLHVAALILILLLSTLACAIPLLSARRSGSGASAGRPGKPSAVTVIFISQHFGTGVLIATAFVHLLPTAFTSLTDPCLPDAFNVGYRPLAGLVAMVSALGVVWIEQYLATRGAGHSHTHRRHGWEEDDANDEDDDEDDEDEDEDEDDDDDDDDDYDVYNGASITRGGVGSDTPRLNVGPRGAAAQGRRLAARRDVALHDIETTALVGDVSPLPGVSPLARPPMLQINGRRLDKPGANFNSNPNSGSDSDDTNTTPAEFKPSTASRRKRMPSPSPPTPEEHHRLVLQCMLLEAGILFHSVFIGMALSVASGPTFVVFLVAISFHQSFEGLALGSRIAALRFPRSSPRPWLMVLAYGTTTPIGQALGLALHKLYDPRSVAGLLMVGFMNAISAGLLLFAGLVQLLAEDFLSEKSYRALRGGKRNWAFAAVGSGAALMALVGAFA